MPILETVADRQAIWSETANVLKLATDQARYYTFGASALGAMLAALAAQFFENNQASVIYQFLTILSAISLAVGAFVTARWLSRDAVERHVRARTASEALKREAFLYATNTGQYRSAESRDRLLLEQKNLIENKIEDLLLFEQKAKDQGRCPRNDLTLNEYIEQRVDTQIKYYRDRSTRYDEYSRLLHKVECSLSLLAAVIAAAAATPLLNGMFNLTAMTAVLTTVSGIVVSHLEAARFDKLIPAYRATANQLETIKLSMQSNSVEPKDWVMECETVLANENNSWIGLWTKA